MNQSSAATTEKKTNQTTKCCPMCRLPLKELGGIVPAADDVGQNFTFVICWSCSRKYKHWPISLRRQQLRAAIGLLSMNPRRYHVRFFDCQAAAILYAELEVAALKWEKTTGQQNGT